MFHITVSVVVFMPDRHRMPDIGKKSRYHSFSAHRHIIFLVGMWVEFICWGFGPVWKRVASRVQGQWLRRRQIFYSCAGVMMVVIQSAAGVPYRNAFIKWAEKVVHFCSPAGFSPGTLIRMRTTRRWDHYRKMMPNYDGEDGWLYLYYLHKGIAADHFTSPSLCPSTVWNANFIGSKNSE